MISYQFLNLNFVAILVAWLVHIALGLIWFQPKLFGNEWSKLTGKSLSPSVKWIIPGIIGHLVMALVLAILIKLTDSNNGLSGLLIGLLTWIGFIVPMETGELIWEKIPFKLFLIRTGNQLIGISVSGIILGIWH